jgi:hypothetical protein
MKQHHTVPFPLYKFHSKETQLLSCQRHFGVFSLALCKTKVTSGLAEKLHQSSTNTTKVRDTVNKIHYCMNLTAAIQVVYFQLSAGTNVTDHEEIGRNYQNFSHTTPV